MVFCAHSSRDIDEAIVRQVNWILFREPSLNAGLTERPEIRAQAMKASQIFKTIPKSDRINFGYIVDDNFEGLIRCNLPSFWSEELSNAYRYLNSPVPNKTIGNYSLTGRTTDKLDKLPPDDVSDEQILELRKSKGWGYEKIAKKLNCSVYRVRKCLAGNDPLVDY